MDGGIDRGTTGAARVVRRDEGETLRVLGVGVRFVCRAEATKHAWSLMETVIPKDAGPPPHDHPWDEAYFVTAGEVEFEIGGRRERVRAGDFVYAPGGTLHAFHGVSEAPARMLIFDAPAHAEAFFKDVDREVTDLPRDLAKVPGIGERHGLRFARRADGR
ncbi:MAG TPA: cupin domain-containing protein [Casimicrobiaceae bacterium]|nr:cupin domain-containing protein [Casimicrobiaceae bacterium]